MNDPFALDLTIILLLLGIGSAMVAGNVAAFGSNDGIRFTFNLGFDF